VPVWSGRTQCVRGVCRSGSPIRRANGVNVKSQKAQSRSAHTTSATVKLMAGETGRLMARFTKGVQG
jgi:hypothetical protein